MKLIKTQLGSRLSDASLAHLMALEIEGPEIRAIEFNVILELLKQNDWYI